VVWRDFLRRQKLPAGRRTVLDLLQQLKKGCSTFRFLDLPLELREMIYDIALEKSEDSEPCEKGLRKFHGPLPPMANRVVALRATKHYPCRTEYPLLLRINRQLRSEAGKIYFQRKQFEIFIDNDHSSRCPLEEVKTWLETMVGEFATHLRRVSLHVGKRANKEIYLGVGVQVRFHHSIGLQVTGSEDCWDIDDRPPSTPENSQPPLFDMPSYVATLEKNRIALDQRGEVIVDFFVADWDALCRAWLGPYQKWLIHEDAGDWDDPDNVEIECKPDDPAGHPYGHDWSILARGQWYQQEYQGAARVTKITRSSEDLQSIDGGILRNDERRL
jgi:hypothetical protein